MAIYCPLKNTQEWKDLVEEHGEKEAYLQWHLKYGVEDRKRTPDSVSAVPKMIEALADLSRDRRTIRLSTRSRQNLTDNLIKELSRKGVPQDQIDLVIQHMEDQGVTEMSAGELISDLIARYDHNVEVKTATQDQDAEGELPTMSYANITVPGGQNYEEIRISTPSIEPSIKGHADFSRNTDIGWIRADDLEDTPNTRRVLEIQSDLYQKDPDSLVRESIGYQINAEGKLTVGRNEGNPEYSFEDLVWSIASGFEENTNNIDTDALVGSSFTSRGENFSIGSIVGEKNKIRIINSRTGDISEMSKQRLQEILRREFKNAEDLLNNSNRVIKDRNNFLSILGRDNNWAKFFVRSIVQRSTEQGYENIMFPIEDTPAKIEGQQLTEAHVERLRDTKKELGEKRQELKNKIEEYELDDNSKAEIASFMDTPQSMLSQEAIENYFSERPEIASTVLDLKSTEEELYITEQDLAHAEQGQESLSGINAFYNNTIRNNLNKLYKGRTRLYKDTYGNNWISLDLEQGTTDAPFSFQRSSDQAQETRENYEYKKELLQNSFAKARININIREENIPGEAIGYVEPGDNTSAPTVVIDPEKVSQDTVMHEFAHIYLDLLGTEHEIVRQGIEQLRDGAIWKEVEQNYPDLSGPAFEKEVLATAIGREGIQRQDRPSKFRVWMNKLFRAIAKLFGVEIEAARVLAEDMWANKLRTEEFRGQFSEHTQYQRENKSEEELRDPDDASEIHETEKVITDLEEKIGDLRIMINEMIEKERPRAEQLGREEKLWPYQQLLQDLEKVDKVEDLKEFLKTANNNTTSAEDRIENLLRKKGRLESEDIPQIHELYDYLQKFDVVKDLDQFMELDNIDHEPLREAVQSITTRSERAQRRILQEVIPAYVDFLLQYQGENIPQQIQDKIDQVERQRERVRAGHKVSSLAGLVNDKDPEYQKIKRSKKDFGSRQEYDLARLDVVERQLRDAIPNRKNLTKFLQHEMTKKSGYSYMIDPHIYSSDQVIQLFTKAVKDMMYDAHQETIATEWELREPYNKMKRQTGRNDNNPDEFYKNIFEEVEVPHKDPAGKKTTKKVLGLVQPYDITSYYRDRERVIQQAAEEFGRPDPESTSPEEMRQWMETKQGNKYRRRLAQWYKENTEPVEGAYDRINEQRKQVNDLESRLTKLQKKLEKEEVDNEVLSRKEERELRTAIENARTVLDSMRRVDPKTGWDIPKGELVRPADKYRNQKYDDLINDRFTEAEREFYEVLLKKYQGSQDKIERRKIQTNPWDNYSYLAPSVRKRDIDRLQEQGAFTAAKDFWREQTRIQSTDTQYGISINEQGEQEHMIPIFFTQLENSEDVSKDLLSSVIQFDHMANNYKAKGEIQSHVTMFRELIKNRERLDYDDRGNLNFSKAAEKLGLTRKAPAQDDDYHLKHLDEFLEVNFYNKERIKHEIRGIEMSKVAPALTKFTAINTLGFNLLQAANNVIIGKLFSLTEANAGHIADKKSFSQAFSKYWEMGAAINDIGKVHAETRLGQMMEMYDPIQGEAVDSHGRNISGNKLKKSASGQAAMFMQMGGEHEMHTSTLLAAMIYRKAYNADGSPMKNDQGKEMTLLDAHQKDDNGKLRILEGTHIKDKDGEVKIYDKRAQRNLMNQVHGVNKQLHGVYNRFDQAMIKRRWWGQLLMLFRGWFPSGIKRRWGHGHGFHVDHEIGSISEGSYLTLWRLISDSFSNFNNTYSEYKNMSEHERQNIRRAFTEFASIAALWITALALLPDDDDREKNNYAENFLLYQALRTKSEMFFYSNPIDMYRIMKSPTATAKTLGGFGELAAQLMSDIVTLSPEQYERAAGTAAKGDYKLLKDLEDLFPVLSGISTSRTPGESYKWFRLMP